MANDSLIPDQPSSTGRDPLPSAVPAPSISPEPSESQTLWRVVNDVQTFSGKKGKGKNNAAQQKQVGGVGTVVPVIYGTRITGAKIASVLVHNGALILLAVWCEGEVDAVEQVYVNNEAAPTSITITTYLGTEEQAADATLVAAWLAQGQSASVVRRDDGTRVAEVASAGTLANDGTFGPLLRLYADAAKRDPDLARRSEAAAYRRPAPPSGGAPPPPFAAGAEAPTGAFNLREWRGVFAQVFSTDARARMLLNDSGIATLRIRFDDTPELVWQSALEEAQKTGRLADLLRVAREEYPSNPALRALTAPSADRDAVYAALVRLLPAQFEAAVFRLSVPSHVLPGATAPMAERAVALVRVAEQRGQLAQLSAIVRAT